MNQGNKKSVASDKVADKTQRHHESHLALLLMLWGSAVNEVKAKSSRVVRISSGLADTGTIISYD